MTPQFLSVLVAVVIARLIEMSPRAKSVWDELDAEGKLAVIAVLHVVCAFLPQLAAVAGGSVAAVVFTRAVLVNGCTLALFAFLISTGAHDLSDLLSALPVRAEE
jgi:hypothetical protein